MTLSRMLAAALQRLVDRIDPQEGRYRMLFESSPLPMWVFDAETLRFLAANEAAIRLCGYSRQEFLSMTVEDICRSEDREAFRQFLRRESGSVNRGVFRHVKRSGEPIDIEGVGYLVSWRGRPARLVLINDITERLHTQHALEFSQERLRALSRRLLEVQEQERRRLARDLHDDVGQALTALKIQLESRSRLELPIRDDGGGFDLAAARRRAAAGASLGLAGMEERVALAGGSFELRSAPGQGTVLLATFPLEPSEKAQAA